ncbi:hypothetical protein [Streptomyces sp. NPDC048473]|uniref:hypothetical protein n=1 Tax=unclassified Streptomyces TaxID=2593676 RepID=UPI0037162F5B
MRGTPVRVEVGRPAERPPEPIREVSPSRPKKTPDSASVKDRSPGDGDGSGD